MTERSIQSAVMTYLNKLDKCRAYNLHGSAWSGSGRPDIIGCYRGVAFLIELKRPHEQPTEIQLYEMRKWIDAGAIVIYATGLEQVKGMITEIDQNRR